MNYTGLSFIFDGVPSEKYGLFLCNIGKGGTQTHEGGGSVKLHTDKTPSMERNFLMGTEYDEVFEFKMTFASPQPKDKFDISLINNWLIGHSTYKRLQILQYDMTNVYYNCILNDYKIISFGNFAYAFECTVICDRPWGVGNNKKFTYNKGTIIHNNHSHTNRLTYPILKFTTIKPNATVSIVNMSNNNWETKFEGLSSGETITVDNELQLIKSSLDLHRLGNFNKHWLELLPRNNKLIISGDINEITIEYGEIRKI